MMDVSEVQRLRDNQRIDRGNVDQGYAPDLDGDALYQSTKWHPERPPEGWQHDTHQAFYGLEKYGRHRAMGGYDSTDIYWNHQYGTEKSIMESVQAWGGFAKGPRGVFPRRHRGYRHWKSAHDTRHPLAREEWTRNPHLLVYTHPTITTWGGIPTEVLVQT